jgi:hypothetical protein
LIRRRCALEPQAFGKTLPAGEGFPLLRGGWVAPSCCAPFVLPKHLVGNPRGVALAELAMNLADHFVGCIFGHEQGNLMALIEIIEIHGAAPSS